MNISGGKFKGQRVIAPDERITRPTLSKVRMGLFNTLFSILGDFDNLSFCYIQASLQKNKIKD